MKVLICDPPEGWKYGFPKECPIEVFSNSSSFKHWLLEQGYPERLLDVVQYTRYWYEQVCRG